MRQDDEGGDPMKTYECEHYVVEQHPDRPTWLAARKKAIGSSDAGAILGYSSWSSPYSVWVDKTTPEVNDDTAGDADEDETREWGRRLESVVAAKFAEVVPHIIPPGGVVRPDATIYDPGDFLVVTSKKYPYLSCTPDRLSWDIFAGPPTDADFCCEIKTAFYGSYKQWSNDVPAGYQVQILEQMLVLGVPLGYFAVLGNGCQFRYHPIRMNDGAAHYVLRGLDRFWQLVKDRREPPADGHEATRHAISKTYPGNPRAEQVKLSVEFNDVQKKRAAAAAEAKRQKGIVDECSNQIRLAMGDAGEAVTDDNTTLFRWSTGGKSRRLTVKDLTEGRVL